MKKQSTILVLALLMHISFLKAQNLNLLWAKQLKIQWCWDDQHTIFDENGNVYTIGSFKGTGDFDPGSGTFNMTSSGDRDIFITKLSANGNFIWAKRFGGTTEDDFGESLAIDSEGNVYATGVFKGTVDFDPGSGVYNLYANEYRGAFVTKLDASGNFLWAKQFGGEGLGGGWGYSIAVDEEDNVYSTGSFYHTVDFDPGPGTYYLIEGVFISKLDSDGNFLWAKQIGGYLDQGNDIAIDNIGNIYTTGFFIGSSDFDPGIGTFNLNSSGSMDIFISKLNASGDFLWAKRMGGTEQDWGSSIAIDNSMNVCTTGKFQGTADFNPGSGTYELTSSPEYSDDIFISKLDASGNFIWAKRIGGTNQDLSKEVALDSEDNVYTTGSFWGTVDFNPGTGTYNLSSAGFEDVFISKLDASGNFLWANKIGGSWTDRGVSISVSENGTIYTSGLFSEIVDFNPGTGSTFLYAPGDADIFIGKYSSPTIIPSEISITNVIPHNSSFPLPKQLWSGMTNQSPSTIKICADGSTATRIKFVNNSVIDSDKIRFWISSDQYGTNTDISGYFVNYSVIGNIITAEYVHPKYLESEYIPFRSDNIQIVDFTAPDSPVFTIPIRVYRAPVIMVHGLWGDQSAFTEMESYLDNSGFYPGLLTFRVDYSFSNSMSFAINAFVIPDGINTVLSTARNSKYSAGKVDIVAHSMGGVLSRNYLQSTAYQSKQDIHKIITLNTPHSGSQAANFLMNQSTCESIAARIAVNSWLLFGNLGKTIDDGAVHDLAVNSTAMNDLNSTFLNNGIVPSHSIVSEDDPSLGISWGYAMMYAVLGCCNISNPNVCFANSFLNYLFNTDANDLIVAVPSQEGGLPSANISHFDNQMHLGATANASIISEVINALNTSPLNSIYFSQNGYSPANLITNYKHLSGDTSTYQINHGSITINHPLSSQTYEPGDLIDISVSSSNGINRILLEAFSAHNNIFAKDTILENGTIYYAIPSDAFGKIQLVVLGYDSTAGFIDFDTVSVNIRNDLTLDSLTFYPEEMYVPEKRLSPITLTVFFSNGQSYTNGYISDIQYHVADTTIADYAFPNRIFGKNIGMTTLTATYQGQVKTINVHIIPNDSLIENPYSLPPPILSDEINTNSKLKVFPNPNLGEFTIQFESINKEPIIIEVYDQYGHRVYCQFDHCSSSIYMKKISIDDLIAGVYSVRVLTKQHVYSCRFVVIR